MHITSDTFKENARQALDDPQLQRALGNVRSHFVDKRAAAVTALPEWESLREQCEGDQTTRSSISISTREPMPTV